MGYIFAHLHIGEEFLKRSGHETRSRKLFNLGTVGPDFLYTESPELEKLFHDDKAEEFARFLLTHSNEKTLDYALGYATHIYADIEMYPVLMQFAEGNFSEYIRLSLAFDALLAKKVYKVSIEKINLASKINVGNSMPSDVNTLLKSASSEIYRESVNFDGAYKKFLHFLTITYDPFQIKRMVYPLVKLIWKFDIYSYTYPLRLGKLPANFYREVNTAMERGIQRSIKSLQNIFK